MRKEGWVFFILIILHHSPHRGQWAYFQFAPPPLGGIEGGCGLVADALNLLQRLLDIVKYVLTVLNTYRQTDKVGSDTSLFQLLV